MRPRLAWISAIGASLATILANAQVAQTEADDKPIICRATMVQAAVAAAAPMRSGYANFGVRSVCVVRVDFANAPGEPISEADVRSVMESVSGFYRNTSFQQLSIDTVDVTPVLRLPGSYVDYAKSRDLIAKNADAAAQNAGYDMGAYDFVIYTFPRIGYGVTAEGLLFTKGVWLEGVNFTPLIIAHEIGHNLGLFHANSYTTTDGSVIGAGRSRAYGNSFDCMGNSPYYPDSQFNANARYLLGWLGDADIQVADVSGTYRIYAIDRAEPLASEKRYALRVPAAFVLANAVRDYWVDFRTSIRYPDMENGVMIKAAANVLQDNGTLLLDTKPATSTQNDGALAIGRTFSDPTRGIHITPVRRGKKDDLPYMEVVVNRDVAANTPPTLEISASTLSTNIYKPITFTATGNDPDGDTLAFYWEFYDTTLASQLNSSNVTKWWTQPGIYPVQCTVSDMKGGVASQTILVQIGNPSSLSISGHVSDRNQPVQGARVSLINDPTRYALTDSAGFYYLPIDNPGTYTVIVLQPKIGFTPTEVTIGASSTNVDIAAMLKNAPVITGFAPASSLVGSTISIFGENLAETLEVRFGSEPAEFTVISPSLVSAVVPVGVTTTNIVIRTSIATVVSPQVFVVTLPVPVEVVSHPGNITVPEASAATLTVKVSGTGPIRYQWLKDGSVLTNATNATLTIIRVDAGKEGDYCVQASNPISMVTSAAAHVSVLTFSRALGPTNIVWRTATNSPWMPSTNVHLYTDAGALSSASSADSWIEATVNGPARVAFWWQLAAGQITDSLTLSVDGTNWACLFGYKTWDNRTVLLNPGQHTLRWLRHGTGVAMLTEVRVETVWFEHEPSGTNVLARSPVQLQADVTGATEMQWFLNDSPLPHATNASLSWAAISVTNAGDYRLSAANGSQSITSIVASVAVRPLVITNDATDIYVPEGSNVTLTVEATSSLPLRYQWWFEELMLPAETNPALRIIAVPAATGRYRCVASNVEGAATSAPVFFEVFWSAPVFDAERVEFPVIRGENLVFDAVADAWPAATYTWTRKNRKVRAASGPRLELRNIRGAQQGDYIVTATNRYGSASQIVHVSVDEIAISQQPTGLVLMAGEPLQLEAAAHAKQRLTYQWRLNGFALAGETNARFYLPEVHLKDSGAYTVDIAEARKGRRALSVQTEPAWVRVTGRVPTFIEEPTNTVAPLSGRALLESFATGVPQPVYQWFFNDELASGFGSQSPTLHLSPITTASQGTYYVVASNDFGSTTSRFVSLTISYGAPEPRIEPNDFSVIEGDFVTLRATDHASAHPTNLEWSADGNVIPGATNELLLFRSVRSDEAAKYRVTSSNEHGTVRSAGSDMWVMPARTLDRWQRISPFPRGESFLSACVGQGMFVASGEAGTILTSRDGSQWNDHSLETPDSVTSIACVGNVFMALLGRSTLIVSSNAVDWMPAQQAGTNLLSVTALNGRFYVTSADVARNLAIYSMAPGENWLESNLPVRATNVSLAFGASRIVGITSNHVFRSSNGVDWSIGVELSGAAAVSFAKDRFVVVGSTGSVWTSTNGGEWVRRYTATTKNLRAVGFYANQFIAAGEGGTILHSPDAVIWTKQTTKDEKEITAIAADSEHAILFGEAGVCHVTTNGSDWRLVTRGVQTALNAVVFTNGIFLAVGDEGLVIVSRDGESWQAMDSKTSRNLRSVCHGGSGFIAVGEGGRMIQSSDGTNWQQLATVAFETLNQVAPTESGYIAVGTNGFIVLCRGTNWTSTIARLPGKAPTLEGVVNANGLYVAVGGSKFFDTGNAQTIITVSPDGLDWTLLPAQYGKKLRGVFFVADTFYAIGNDGLLASSTDGVRWYERFETEESENLRALAQLPGTLLAVGNDGLVFTHSGSLGWQRHRLNTRRNLHGVAYGNDRLVAVGTDGMIVRCGPILPSIAAEVIPMSTPWLRLTLGMFDYCRLETSTNLSLWESAGVFTSNYVGSALLQTNAPAAGQKFFRLVYP